MANQSVDMAGGPQGSARRRSTLPPIILGALLFATIIYIQFSGVLGRNANFAIIFLAIGFYYCYAWHGRIAAANKQAAQKG